MAKLPYSQAAENNKQPILDILRPLFAQTKSVLEVGSGTAQHALWFARNMPHLTWQPTEHESNMDKLVQCLSAQENPGNIKNPVCLDVADDPWPVAESEAVYSANCVHIMSWEHVQKMFAGLDKVIRPGGYLTLYGPFKYNGAFTSSSNALFEQWLKGNDPVSGIRDFEEVDALANSIGLSLVADHKMPANNQCLVWQRKLI